MPRIIVLSAFKFAHFGYQVEEFEPHPDREPRETTQEVVDVLKDEGLFEVCKTDDELVAEAEAQRIAAERRAAETAEAERLVAEAEAKSHKVAEMPAPPLAADAAPPAQAAPAAATAPTLAPAKKTGKAKQA